MVYSRKLFWAAVFLVLSQFTLAEETNPSSPFYLPTIKVQQKSWFQFAIKTARAENSFRSGSGSGSENVTSRNENPLQAKAFIESSDHRPGQVATLRIDLSLPPKYKAYADQFKLRVLSNENFLVGKITLSPLQKFFDETTKKEKMGVIGSAQLTAPLEFPQPPSKAANIVLGLTYQACTATYCLFPIEIDLPVEIPKSAVAASDNGPSWNFKSWTDLKLQDVLKFGLFWTYLFVFIGGVLTSFTPCVFPMIPITLTVLGRDAHLRSKRKQILVSHIYVLGIALTYSLLGVFAASTGALFGSMMNSPWVLSVICTIYFLMALSLFGLFEIQVPLKIQEYVSTHFKSDGLLGVFIQGILAGVVASPCVGPILVGILTYVAQSQSILFGFSLLFVFAFGMGQLFLLFGVSSQMTKLLPRSGAWMEGIKKIFGLILMVPFYYFLSLIVSKTGFYLALSFGILGASLALGLLKPITLNFSASSPQLMNRKKVFFVLNMVLFLAGFSGMAITTSYQLGLDRLLFSSDKGQIHGNQLQGQPDFANPNVECTLPQEAKSEWQTYSSEKYQAAMLAQKPILIDFWAEWCAACKQLENQTFTSAEFKKWASQFVLLRFDATTETSELEILKKKFNIVGLPTVVFMSSRGEWLKELTVNEFIAGPKFGERMQKVLGK